METKDLDIVYVLKDSEENEEFRYSLRSLENIEHKNVWIYGTSPSWVENINIVECVQNEETKWANVRSMLIKVCKNSKMTENFILFNDDFFIMDKINQLDPMYAGTIDDRLNYLEQKYEMRSKYADGTRDVLNKLKELNKPTLNYATHVPMIFNRKKLLEVLTNYPDIIGIRNLYGNINKLGGINIKDVKIYNLTDRIKHNSLFLSTTDNTFKYGVIGKVIRSYFDKLCYYEKETKI